MDYRRFNTVETTDLSGRRVRMRLVSHIFPEDVVELMVAAEAGSRVGGQPYQAGTILPVPEARAMLSVRLGEEDDG